MKEYEAKLKEYEALAGNTDAESRARKEELVAWFEANNTDEFKEAANNMVTANLDRIEKEICELRSQIGDEYSLLPLSYIAKHYFGKTRAWLFQRLNGYRVRGKVYTLTDEQKAVFNDAVQDIARRIGSVRIS